MVTKNTQPPNRITRGFYVIATINSCYYYPYGISKDQRITLAFGEKMKCFYFFYLLLSAAKSLLFCFHSIPNPRKDKYRCRSFTLFIVQSF